MQMIRHCLTSFFVVFVIAGVAGWAQKTPEPKVELKPCELPGPEPGKTEKVLCGQIEVFENRSSKKGRKIPIKIVVFPAIGAKKEPDPLFYIPGGPGSSATEDAPYVAKDFAKVREHRDLVFVDLRGTGGSNPLNCTFFKESDPQSYLGHWNPPEEVRRCRRELEAKADLALYTTSIAIDDLDEARAAMGYDKINIIGGSYGTRATQEYIRRHGGRVRAVILHGVSLTGQSMPRDFPQDTERALDGVIAECLSNPECAKTFPNLPADKRSVLDRLLKGPVETDVKFPENSDKTYRVKLSRDLAAEAVRYMLYSTGGAGRVPLFLHTAAEGNFSPLAQAALFYRQVIVGSGATGLYLSVTCAEDLPWIAAGSGERNAENTFLGDYRLRQQREDCTLWPRGSVPKDYLQPVRSRVPALILTGQWDPVTPPRYGDVAAKNFPNSLHVIVPSGGHGFSGVEGIECVDDLIAEFVARGSVKGLDTACVKKMRRGPFQLKF
jgi:pimeloyl-ACP methyl ester carboxylesterase